jgi:hypothetical protein
MPREEFNLGPPKPDPEPEQAFGDDNFDVVSNTGTDTVLRCKRCGEEITAFGRKQHLEEECHSKEVDNRF